MGYTAQPFAVDLEKIKQVIGSGDRPLIEKIKASGLYDHYAGQADDCDFDEVVEDLIAGYAKPVAAEKKSGLYGFFKSKPAAALTSSLNPELAHQYGYALLVVCDALGTHLSPDGDIFHAGDVWDEANELFKSKGITINLDRMWETESLFNIPPIPDFPGITHYSKAEISYLLTELNKLGIDENKANSNSDDFEELQELLKTFKDGLQICKDKNVEWVAFMH